MQQDTGNWLSLMHALCIVLVVLTLVSPALARPFRYETTWTDETGATHTLAFDGDITRGAVTGDAKLDGHAFTVTGTVRTDGSLTGNVRDVGGRPVASLHAAPETDGALAGTVTPSATGRALPWRLPRLKLPEATGR
jgi:hypothetical protein